MEMVGMDTVSHATRMWEFRITEGIKQLDVLEQA